MSNQLLAQNNRSNETWVLITGATSGIGRATALHLAKLGYAVIATGRRTAELQALADEARTLPGRLVTHPLDVTDSQSIARCQDAAASLTSGRGIDVLVNNAGFGVIGPTTEITDAELRRQYDTNVFGLMAVTRAFVPEMMQRRSGRIINISSLGGRVTMPFLGAYNSTKYALESLSDAMRLELHPFGVHVALIEPGMIHTNFTDQAVRDHNTASHSPFAPVLTHLDTVRARLDSTAVGPEHVARAITRAIRARRPAARYIAPRRTVLALIAKTLLPTVLWDWSMRKLSFLSPRHLALPETTEAKTHAHAA